nr:MAG TPA: Protein of unknown function (DUF2755) [Caudoviricetes sp.]
MFPDKNSSLACLAFSTFYYNTARALFLFCCYSGVKALNF